MEEIKLPKFKTKEELEQFAMGLMTENESLKKDISRQPSQKCEVDYKGMYESEVERVRLRDDIGDVLYKSMSWLYSRVPFWTKKKFKVYFQKLVESNDNLRDASEKVTSFLFQS